MNAVAVIAVDTVHQKDATKLFTLSVTLPNPARTTRGNKFKLQKFTCDYNFRNIHFAAVNLE